MPYTHYQIEDFMMDESFRKWILHKSPEDEAFWKAWLEAHPQMRGKIEQARALLLELKDKEAQVSQEEIDLQFSEIAEYFDQQVGHQGYKKRILPRKAHGWIAAAVAALFLVAGGIYYWMGASDGQMQYNQRQKIARENPQSSPDVHSHSPRSTEEATSKDDQKKVEKNTKKEKGPSTPSRPKANKQENFPEETIKTKDLDKEITRSLAKTSSENKTTWTTGPGQHRKVRLPDGSQVYLNEKTQLTYHQEESHGGKRMAILRGEAFFKVKEKRQAGKKIPFLVSTKAANVNVLGTSFNVSARDKQTHVFLNSGKVNLNLAGVNKKLTMSPGDFAQYHSGNRRIATGQTYNSRYTKWLKAFNISVPAPAKPSNMTLSSKKQEGAQQDQISRILQKGENNNAYIRQVGKNIKSLQIQKGNNNRAAASIESYNRQHATQEDNWSTLQLQSGQHNVSIFRLVESYNSNLFSLQRGEYNKTKARSKGRNNKAVMLQDGENNRVRLWQQGRQNKAVVIQQGPGTGSRRPTVILDKGPGGRHNEVRLMQKGLNNKARGIQKGKNNTIQVKQKGK
jgi:ferric-dicitrate binding protein FerR (iron transport regulator)